MKSLRIGMFFDLSDRTGLGHFARSRALAADLAVAGGAEVRLVPMPYPGQGGMAGKKLDAPVGFDHRVTRGRDLLRVMRDYDVVFVDSYRNVVQSLAWLPAYRRERPDAKVG